MELTFVNSYPGDAPKRRRLAKACESCRLRKKRCIHFEDGESEDEDTTRRTSGQAREVAPHVEATLESSGDRPSTAPTSTSLSTSRSGSGRPLRGIRNAASPRSAGGKLFVSDLIPQATFLGRDSAQSTNAQSPNNDDIGVWVDRREWEALVQQKNNNARASSAFIYSHGMRGDQRPHSSVLGPLMDLYFRKIHPLLPLLDEDDFRSAYAAGDVPEPLALALCLVAAKDPEAGPYLRLGQSPSTLQPREFCSRVHASIVGVLRAPCQYDKLTLIRILALASLHHEGADGAEESSMYLFQAMHHGQTLGIHLGGHSNSERAYDNSTKRLFWSLWALDRLNSATNGRPIVMGDVDIAIEPFEPGESGFPALDVWLRITTILNKILSFYRPNYPADITGWETEFPGLEEILDECEAWDLPDSLHATIHLFYLIVSILSHRTRGIKQIPRGTHSSIRQRLCAIEIVRMMDSPTSSCLHQLAHIPYAVSLALSVSYQHLRQSQYKHQQEDARADFRACCRILQTLRRTWSSADAMAALGRKVLDELDKAPSLAEFRVQRSAMSRTQEKHVPCPPDVAGNRSALDQPATRREGAAVESDVPVEDADKGLLTPQPAHVGLDVMAGMDDIFGTFMDPNYPVNLDDWSLPDNALPFDWNEGFNTQPTWR